VLIPRIATPRGISSRCVTQPITTAIHVGLVIGPSAYATETTPTHQERLPTTRYPVCGPGRRRSREPQARKRAQNEQATTIPSRRETSVSRS
jgi:hypothetical protein